MRGKALFGVIVAMLLGFNVFAHAEDYPYDWAPGKVRVGCTKETVCGKGHSTKLIRPPVKYTNALKVQQTIEHGIDCAEGCEEDHVIPLELCGDPEDPENLSPESYVGAFSAHEKDFVEDHLHARLCSGEIDLATAQDVITHHWQNYYAINHEKRGEGASAVDGSGSMQ